MALPRQRLIAIHLRAQLTLERAFRRRYAATLNRYAKAAATAYAQHGPRGIPFALAGQQEDIARILRANYLAAGTRYRAMVLEQLTGQTKDASSQFEIEMQAYVDAQVAERSALISSTTNELVAGAIAKGVKEAETPAEIAKRIRVTTGGTVSRVRADAIAITETHNAATYASDVTAAGTGLTLEREWVSVEDSRTRPTHNEADGQRTSMAGTFTVGGYQLKRPGDPDAPAKEVIRCFPGGTLVSHVDAGAATRHWFDGELIEIETAGGNKLAGTPNHPVLTTAGWKPLRLVNKGDGVLKVGDGVDSIVAPNINDVPSRIDEVFDALSGFGGGKRVSACVVDFHGDIPGSDVDVVRADRELRDRKESAFYGVRAKLLLVLSDLRLGKELSSGLLHGSLDRFLFPAHGSVGGLRPLLSLIWCSVLHSLHHCLASIARTYSRFLKRLSDRAALHPATHFLCNSLHRLPKAKASYDLIANHITAHFSSSRKGLASRSAGNKAGQAPVHRHSAEAELLSDSLVGQARIVEADRVITVGTKEFSGHVYNLHDAKGMYIANGIIVHNCRCVVNYHEV